MSRGNNLPFERGATYFGGGQTSTTEQNQLEGKLYTVQDDRHGTSTPVRLRCVRNRGGTLSLGTANNRFRGIQ